MSAPRDIALRGRPVHRPGVGRQHRYKCQHQCRHQYQHQYQHQRRRQRGVAVITALLLTTLAVTIVASLFWQQQVQVRSIENQRMQLQKQWILRGALDWARLILVTSLQSSQLVDNLQQPWAVGLAETRLDSYVENGRSDSEASDASITGRIIDAQSYLNLAGLSVGGVPQPKAIAAFGRLLQSLSIDPQLATTAAAGMAAGQPKGGPPAGVTAATSTAVTTVAAAAGTAAATTPAATTSATTPVAGTGGGSPRSLPIEQIDDFLSLPGFTPDIVTRLHDFAIILPRSTAVNINTASAEVLAATIDTLSLPVAQSLVASRNSATFRDTNDPRLAAQLQGADLTQLSVRTDYFVVDGKVKLNRAGLEVLALIERFSPTSIAAGGTGGAGVASASKIIWIREK